MYFSNLFRTYRSVSCNYPTIKISFTNGTYGINYKKGRSTAINATARKLAVIIWNMLVKGEQYKPPTEYLFLDQKRKMKLIKNIKNKITKFDLKPEDVGFELKADF